MTLTNIQFARCGAFYLGLAMINEAKPLTPEQVEGTAPVPNLNTNTIDALQQLTVERSNRIAAELGVDFPDENEPETISAMLANLESDTADEPEREPSLEELAELEVA